MAVQSSFKQRCPSCEAMISVRENQVGKKIECSMCKDRFIVAPPEAEEDEKPAKKSKKSEKSTAITSKDKSTSVSSKAPVKSRTKLEPVEEVEEIDDDLVVEVDETPSKKHAAKKRTKLEPVDEVDDDLVVEVDETPSKKPAGKKRTKLQKEEEVEEIDDDLVVEVDEDEKPAKGKNKAKAPAKKKANDEDEVEEVDEPKSPPKKKNDSTNSNKLTIGLGLAVVGVIILCVAAFFMLRGGGGGGGPARPIAVNPNPNPNPKPEDPDEKKKKDDKIPPKKEDTKPLTPVVAMTDAERAKLTNLLPPDSEHVLHVYYDQLFASNNPLRDVVFMTPGALEDAELKKRLGFSLLAIDDILCAEKYSANWRYTVIHFKEPINQDELKAALRLKPMKTKSKMEYFELPTENPNPWFDQLGRFAFGVPNSVRSFDARQDSRVTPQPSYLRIHNPQTMIIADKTPMFAYLEAKGQFLKPKDENPDGMTRFLRGDAQFVSAKVQQPEGEAGRDEMYLTLREGLKKLLDEMESRGADGKDKVLISSATDLDAAIVTTNLPEFRDLVVRRPRQFWDATLLLTERTTRLRQLGMGLIQRDAFRYQLRNKITCGQEGDARNLLQDLERESSKVARLFKRLIDLDISTSTVPVETKPEPGAEQKPEEKKDITTSEIRLSQKDTQVDFVLDLALTERYVQRLQGITALLASTMRVDMEAAANLSLRHTLSGAAKQLAEKGLATPSVLGRTYPPGVFKRLEAPFRTDREPKNRISWMAGLLPYMGHDNLFQRINFNQSWRDPGNWLAGNTLVPQFLDPSYPFDTRYRAVDGAALDYAATHYVGIAGVGMDAAYYKRGDKSVAHKRGVFGYEESAAMHELLSGRGLSNTIVMIQIPHDGITGVNPWMAGGGATLRGVPEKNSIQPFVLSKDRHGNVIRHKNKNGTFALMADGSVRFIDENVPDEVFKAMCTIQSPNPQGFNPDTDPNTPLVPLPEAKPEPKKEPEKKEEPMPKDDIEKKKDEADKKKGDAEKKKDDMDTKAKDDEKKTKSEKTSSIRPREEREVAIHSDGAPRPVLLRWRRDPTALST